MFNGVFIEGTGVVEVSGSKTLDAYKLVFSYETNTQAGTTQTASAYFKSSDIRKTFALCFVSFSLCHVKTVRLSRRCSCGVHFK